jgi:hypothetical protein
MWLGFASPPGLCPSTTRSEANTYTTISVAFVSKGIRFLPFLLWIQKFEKFKVEKGKIF